MYGLQIIEEIDIHFNTKITLKITIKIGIRINFKKEILVFFSR